ncbi:MAG: hypothetical protein AAF532_12660 [Planctomycetota bacterium]
MKPAACTIALLLLATAFAGCATTGPHGWRPFGRVNEAEPMPTGASVYE